MALQNGLARQQEKPQPVEATAAAAA